MTYSDLDELDDEPFDLETEPLDKPEGLDRDWGGDGSDPDRPVRAHVLAALRPPGDPYPSPVDELLALGETSELEGAQRRKAIPFTQDHVADLARMARDRALFTANSDTDEVWAPYHALQTLRELDATPVVTELIPLLDVEDDFNPTMLEGIFARVGAPAIAPLQAYLADPTRWSWGKSFATGALEKIAQAHPELRVQVVEILSDVLARAAELPEQAVTGAVDSLVDLQATEALPLIRRAFELHKVDEFMRGPWGDILADLGVEPEPGDPLIAESQQRYEEIHARMFPSALTASERAARHQAANQAAAQRRKQEQTRKAKSKRKAASSARKANRKKKK